MKATFEFDSIEELHTFLFAKRGEEVRNMGERSRTTREGQQPTQPAPAAQPQDPQGPEQTLVQPGAEQPVVPAPPVPDTGEAGTGPLNAEGEPTADEQRGVVPPPTPPPPSQPQPEPDGDEDDDEI